MLNERKYIIPKMVENISRLPIKRQHDLSNKSLSTQPKPNYNFNNKFWPIVHLDRVLIRSFFFSIRLYCIKCFEQKNIFFLQRTIKTQRETECSR